MVREKPTQKWLVKTLYLSGLEVCKTNEEKNKRFFLITPGYLRERVLPFVSPCAIKI